MLSRTIGLIGVASLLAGCSHSLSVSPMGATSTEGAAYVLPFTQFDVTMTWRVADCANPKVALAAEAVAGQADDAEQAYVIDPASLQTLTSIGTFSAKWHEGSNALASINVAAEDRTAQVIGNVVTAAAKLVPLAMGVPVPGASGLAETQKVECTKTVKTSLETLASKKPKLVEATKKVENSTSEIARLTAKAVAMGSALDDETKRQLAREIDKLAAFRAEQNALAEEVAGALKKISFVRKERWPTSSKEAAGGGFGVPQPVLDSWFTGPVSVNSVFLVLERVGSFGRDPVTLASSPSQRVESGVGLRYRVPARGRLAACSDQACSSSNPVNVLTVLEAPVAQLGYVHLLPVRNRTFGSTSFSAEFTPAGGLKSMGYDQKAAPAEVASGALANAAGQVATAFDPTARVARDTAYLEALKKRRDAQAALSPAPDDPTGAAKQALDANTSLLDAEAANIRAQLVLDELRGKLNP